MNQKKPAMKNWLSRLININQFINTHKIQLYGI
jgi:hypothetical protein